MVISCYGQNNSFFFESETLKIKKITEHTYLHVSYLQTKDFGNVDCNGMIVIDNGEALVIDTPVNNASSKELISFIENQLKCHVVGIVATHFHSDCIGGIEEFHKMGIPSYANNETISLVKGKEVVPENGFNNSLELTVGHTKVINKYMGEGHTKDNIVTYFPDEKVLFGGCLIKSLGAGKGNLEDANLIEWSTTVEKAKSEFDDVQFVIPGHGNYGGKDLLNFTIELFRIK